MSRHSFEETDEQAIWLGVFRSVGWVPLMGGVSQASELSSRWRNAEERLVMGRSSKCKKDQRLTETMKIGSETIYQPSPRLKSKINVRQEPVPGDI